MSERSVNQSFFGLVKDGIEQGLEASAISGSWFNALATQFKWVEPDKIIEGLREADTALQELKRLHLTR